MNCWAVLKIEQTADTAIIRKAYKQQLLIYHPEDDPEGYQRVRAAYTAAMNTAKRLAKMNMDEIETEANTQAEAGAKVEPDAEAEAEVDEYAYAAANAFEAAADEDNPIYRRLFTDESGHFQEDNSAQDRVHENEKKFIVTRRFFAEQERVKAEKKAENEFIARMRQLLEDQEKRNDSEAWEELFSDDVLWGIESKPRIDYRMLRLLSQQFSGINDTIWAIIESHTGLYDKIIRKIDEYPASFVDTYAFATQKIAPPRNLRRAKISVEQVIKKPDVNGWTYCFRIPIFAVILIIIGNVLVFPVYILIIMWEHSFTHINRWGKRYDFKYIDIIKIIQYSDEIIIYLQGKRIRVKTETHINVPNLLAKLSRY